MNIYDNFIHKTPKVETAHIHHLGDGYKENGDIHALEYHLAIRMSKLLYLHVTTWILL